MIIQNIHTHNKHYLQLSHIAIDVDTRLILYPQAVKGPRHDIKFPIAPIRSLKKYDVDYIIADKAYDTNKIRTCIKKKLKLQIKYH